MWVYRFHEEWLCIHGPGEVPTVRVQGLRGTGPGDQSPKEKYEGAGMKGFILGLLIGFGFYYYSMGQVIAHLDYLNSQHKFIMDTVEKHLK